MNMKQLRGRRGLKTAEIAQQLGVAESTVRNWEHGRTVPKLRLDQFSKLLEVYACSFEELTEAFNETSAKAS